jgi:DivIVA domain-containing protein
VFGVISYPGEVTPSPDELQYPNLASIRTKTFRLGLKGYNVDEVDKFLDSLDMEAQALHATLEAAQREMVSLRAQLSS